MKALLDDAAIESALNCARTDALALDLDAETGVGLESGSLLEFADEDDVGFGNGRFIHRIVTEPVDVDAPVTGAPTAINPVDADADAALVTRR